MNKTYYVCKYTPIELLESLGGECENFNHMPEGFDLADQVSHPNICGFGKTLLEGVMEGKIKELVLVSSVILSGVSMTFCWKAASWIFSIFWMCFTVTVPAAESVWLYS